MARALESAQDKLVKMKLKLEQGWVEEVGSECSCVVSMPRCSSSGSVCKTVEHSYWDTEVGGTVTGSSVEG